MGIANLSLAAVAAATLLSGCDTYDNGPRGYGPPPPGYAAYGYDRPGAAYHGFYPERYYRGDRRYRERQPAADERIRRGEHGRYCCRRSDGSTELVIGAGAGAPLGAAAGVSIDRSNVRCR